MDIHRCRFVPYNPQAINALAFSHPSSIDLPGRGVKPLRLAIGRANGDIEIWNPLRGAWFQETILRGGKDRSIEGLAWTIDHQSGAEQNAAENGNTRTQPGRLRLFSIGYSNVVTEWDLEKGQPARHSSGNYGEIWCLAAQPLQSPPSTSDNNKIKDAKRASQATTTGDGGAAAAAEFHQHLAAGCADGSIVILSTADGDLRYQRTMRPSSKRSRVLSIVFQNRYTIVAGYADSTMRLFDIRSGQLLRTISLGKGPAGGPKDILVWSVKCLPDGTIVSGDSTGEVRFWDGRNYSLIQRVQGHQADVLDVAVSADGETVLSGGTDQRTVVYRLGRGAKGDKKRRWAEVMHRRHHTHDVKTFAVYETRDISVAVSGGPDAAPVVLPLREFGNEHHRTLSTLPQIPQVTSSPYKNLMMSFWEREVRIWRLPRGSAFLRQGSGEPRQQLVGKVLIQGDESITSACISPDGRIMVVATISGIKVFSLRDRKSDDERDLLKIQKLDIPLSLSEMGARIVHISPDSRWLCIVRPDSKIFLAKIITPSTSQEKPQFHAHILGLSRVPRAVRFERSSHGTLGDYERTIRTVAFSSDSTILAAGDLSGCVDVWRLEDTESTRSNLADKPLTNGTTQHSDDEASDDGSDDEEELPTIDGLGWKLLDEKPIARQPSGIIFLSFRPSSNPVPEGLANGLGKHSRPASLSPEDRLIVVTSKHDLVEYHALKGQSSDWSRRNPKACFPAEFTGVKDRAIGGFWDSSKNGKQRLWLYGPSWLWMFNVSQDFPSPANINGATADNSENAATTSSTQLVKTSSSSAQKRKRGPEEYSEAREERSRFNTGAGDRIPLSKADIAIGLKMRKFLGKDPSKAEVVLKRPPSDHDTLDDDDNIGNGNADLNLATLRRMNENDDDGEDAQEEEATGVPKRLTNGVHHEDETASNHLEDDASFAVVVDNQHNHNQNPSEQNGIVSGTAALSSLSLTNGHSQEITHLTSKPADSQRPWWNTYKYRDILGIVPTHLPRGNDALGTENDDDDDEDILEVALVERPMWDVALPGRYVKSYE